MLRVPFVSRSVSSLRFAVASSVLAVALFASSNASAQLVIDVVGNPGGLSTSWTFSGSTFVDSFLPVGALAPGAVNLASGGLYGSLNNWQGPDITTPTSGTYSYVQAAMTAGPTITGVDVGHPLFGQTPVPPGGSGAHALEGVTLSDDGGGNARFSWFGDGAFTSFENLFFSGTGAVAIPVTIFDDISVVGDTAQIAGTGQFIGDFTINVTAIPEPSTALLLGLGLAGIAARRKQDLSA